MRKTIIALMMLSYVAGAETETNTYSAKINRETVTTDEGTTQDQISATFGSDSPIARVDLWNCINTANGDELGFKNTSVNPNTLSPDLNVGSGDSWSITMQFTPQMDLKSVVELNSITLTVYAFNNGGTAQNADNLARDVSFTLMDGNTELATTIKELGNSNNNTNYQQDFEITFDSPITVSSRMTPKFTLTVTNANDNTSTGTYIGLSNIVLGASVPAIPEPTTATLSLLALAGLAARRRRK